MNRTTAVQAIIWLDQLTAAAKVERAKLAADLAADARAELEEQGTAPTWRIPDVATVSSSVTHAAVFVENEAAFTAWVAKRYPTEVETVQRVRSAWLTGFLAKAPGAAGVVSDPETGEVVPGLGIRRGGDFAGISVRATTEAKSVFAAVAQQGLRELAAQHSGVVVLAELASAEEVSDASHA